jgi:integrase
MATKVKLRQKAIKGGKQSLYLDIYPPIVSSKTGELTRREFLGMYIFDKENSPANKQHNKDTKTLAEQIRQKRENYLNKPEIYTGYEKQQLKIKEKGEKDFVAYFKELAEKRQKSNHDNWMAAFNYLEKYTKGSLKFAEINEKTCNDFKEFLLTTNNNRSDKTKLAQNSAVSYFNKFKATVKQAFKDGFFQVDINSRIDSIPSKETRREFLTIEEVNKLAKTDCKSPLIKRAALFSALTGLRFVDIKNLTWDKVEYIKNDGYYLKFTQQKTEGVEMMPISEQAFELLGEKTEHLEQPFEGLKYSAFENKHLHQWIGAAGITKDITFHCFRHTYATLQLSNGTDIYTVSKMLGHRDLKTTQIYAKIIDQTKRDTTNKIKLDL